LNQTTKHDLCYVQILISFEDLIPTQLTKEKEL